MRSYIYIPSGNQLHFLTASLKVFFDHIRKYGNASPIYKDKVINSFNLYFLNFLFSDPYYSSERIPDIFRHRNPPESGWCFCSTNNISFPVSVQCFTDFYKSLFKINIIKTKSTHFGYSNSGLEKKDKHIIVTFKMVIIMDKSEEPFFFVCISPSKSGNTNVFILSSTSSSDT